MASPLTDAVVEDARRGDASALTTLYQAVSPGILAYLRSRGSQDAEGLTQEVFLQLLPRLRKISGGAAGVRALAFTIAHSRLIDEFRRRSRSVVAQVSLAILPNSLNGANSCSMLGGSAGFKLSTASISVRVFTVVRTRSPSAPSAFIVKTSMPGFTWCWQAGRSLRSAERLPRFMP